jgi:serine protease inhibitor
VRKFIAILLGVILMGALFAGCAKQPVPPGVQAAELPEPSASVDPVLVDGVNGMGIEMLKRLYEGMGGENFMISPASISLALSMTMNGAEGETLAEMQKTLGLDGLDMNGINAAQKDLMGVLLNPDGSEKVKVEIANALWAREGLPIKEAFLDACREYYRAETRFLDFADPGSVDIINNWVNEETHGMIPSIIDDPIDPMTMLYLMNTLYFDGKWTEPFNPENTYEGTFTRADGSAAPVQMMSGEQDVMVYHDPDGEADVFSKAFGDNGRLEMLCIRPMGDLDAYIQNFTVEKLNTIAAGLSPENLMVGIPRFSYDAAMSLKDTLIAMGMEKAFTDAAEFGPMSDAPLCVHDVYHKTRIEVKEEGAKAAAVTSVEMRVTGMPMSLILDSPFLYLIRDTQTGAVLFVGVVEEPVEE